MALKAGTSRKKRGEAGDEKAQTVFGIAKPEVVS
jgi:hypothetical protein